MPAIATVTVWCGGVIDGAVPVAGMARSKKSVPHVHAGIAWGVSGMASNTSVRKASAASRLRSKYQRNASVSLPPLRAE